MNIIDKIQKAIWGRERVTVCNFYAGTEKDATESDLSQMINVDTVYWENRWEMEQDKIYTTQTGFVTTDDLGRAIGKNDNKRYIQVRQGTWCGDRCYDYTIIGLIPYLK